MWPRVFFSLLPHPPRPTLFPYTTLFRSLATTGLLEHEPDMVISGINEGANLGDDVLYSGTVAAADRKSTRLNSSHVAISYAVFCLKKKNIRLGQPFGSLITINGRQHVLI